MKFNPKLIPATFIKRYKRFFADVKLSDGTTVITHCANTGTMKTCISEGWPCLISPSTNPKRKLKFTLELINNKKTWIDLNTHRANNLVIEALNNNVIKEISDIHSIKSEVKVSDHTRIDLAIKHNNDPLPHYLEIKSVTLVENNTYLFPDAISTRAHKHIETLIDLKKHGHQTTLFFLIKRSDASIFKPASHIDVHYSNLLIKAKKHGVRLLAYQCKINETETLIHKSIPIQLP
jgi:sugar fermentation stimulation protein A